MGRSVYSISKEMCVSRGAGMPRFFIPNKNHFPHETVFILRLFIRDF